MKSEWTYRPLGELVSFASGGTPSKKRDDYWGGTIPWISAKTLKTENIDTSDLMCLHWLRCMFTSQCTDTI